MQRSDSAVEKGGRYLQMYISEEAYRLFKACAALSNQKMPDFFELMVMETADRCLPDFRITKTDG